MEERPQADSGDARDVDAAKHEARFTSEELIEGRRLGVSRHLVRAALGRHPNRLWTLEQARVAVRGCAQRRHEKDAA